MKKKFDPQYIADCRRQIEKAMKDGNSGWELRMCDIMTSAATAFGNRSDAEVDRMKAFLHQQLTLCSVANLGKKPDIPYRSKEYCHTLFDRSGKVAHEILDQLIDVCRDSTIEFQYPVIIVVCDDDGYYQEVKIKTLQWKDETREILMEDTEENMWTDFDVPPSFLEKLLQCIIDQNLYPHNL